MLYKYLNIFPFLLSNSLPIYQTLFFTSDTDSVCDSGSAVILIALQQLHTTYITCWIVSFTGGCAVWRVFFHRSYCQLAECCVLLLTYRLPLNHYGFWSKTRLWSDRFYNNTKQKQVYWTFWITPKLLHSCAWASQHHRRA